MTPSLRPASLVGGPQPGEPSSSRPHSQRPTGTLARGECSSYSGSLSTLGSVSPSFPTTALTFRSTQQPSGPGCRVPPGSRPTWPCFCSASSPDPRHHPFSADAVVALLAFDQGVCPNTKIVYDTVVHFLRSNATLRSRREPRGSRSLATTPLFRAPRPRSDATWVVSETERICC